MLSTLSSIRMEAEVFRIFISEDFQTQLEPLGLLRHEISFSPLSVAYTVLPFPVPFCHLHLNRKWRIGNIEDRFRLAKLVAGCLIQLNSLGVCNCQEESCTAED